MKLQGIKSSHARHAAHQERLERDRAQAASLAQSAPASPHQPEAQPDGTVRCCGSLYAKHAHAAHLRGERVGVECSGVRMLPEDQGPVSDEWERVRMYAGVGKYARPKAQRVDGADDNWMEW